MVKSRNLGLTCGLLICTLISENQGLEKSRSVSNLKKNSGPASLDFFVGLHLKNNTFKKKKKEAENVKDTNNMGYDVMK